MRSAAGRNRERFPLKKTICGRFSFSDAPGDKKPNRAPNQLKFGSELVKQRISQMQRSDRSGSNNGSSTHRTCTRGEGRRAMQEGEKRALKKLRMGAKLTRKELRGGLRVPQNSRRNEPRSKRRLEERAHYYFVSFSFSSLFPEFSVLVYAISRKSPACSYYSRSE